MSSHHASGCSVPALSAGFPWRLMREYPVAAQEARERRSTNSLPVKRQARVYSLSGLLRCHYCGGSLHIHQDKGRARAYCYRRRQGPKCEQRSTFLDVYEAQILD